LDHDVHGFDNMGNYQRTDLGENVGDYTHCEKIKVAHEVSFRHRTWLKGRGTEFLC
jgi:hypothetical protein